MVDIKRLMFVSNSNVTQLIDKLERLGLVERSGFPNGPAIGPGGADRERRPSGRGWVGHIQCDRSVPREAHDENRVRQDLFGINQNHRRPPAHQQLIDKPER
jgi:hypothetical protein